MVARDGMGPATRALMEQVLAGDRTGEARDALLLRIESHYLTPLGAYLWKLGVPPSDLEDLLGQVRLSLVQGKLLNYDPRKGAFRPWLFHFIARDHVDRWRRRAVRERPVALPEEFSPTPRPDSGHVVEGWEATCVAQTILDAVVLVFEEYERRGGRRAEKARDALTMVWVEGKEIKEAAREIGVLAATVRHHLRKGRRRLLDVVLGELAQRELGGGPFEAHCRRLREADGGRDVDSLVRGAARYLLDAQACGMPTTYTIRKRLRNNGGATDGA